MKKMRPPKRTAIWSSGFLFCLSFLSDFVQGGKVPGLYVFGDSQLDVGNNNCLQTPIRANFPHNGVDYPGGVATGRFSNGRNLANFIAGRLSVATPPAYLSIGNNTTGNYSIFLNGVNFASGGAGVLKHTSKGLTISFDEQIKRDYSIVQAGLVQQLGKTIGVGRNDIASQLCSNRTDHIFWDGAHLTEVTTKKLIAVAFNGSAPLVTPVNLRQLNNAE